MSSGQVTFTTNSTARAAGNATGDTAGGGSGSSSSSGSGGGGGGSGSVDVYGWAVLDRMRDANGTCLDWCAAAMEQLGVSPRGHRHFVCFPLYAPDQPGGAPAVCANSCPGNGECGASCPADGPYKDLPGVRSGQRHLGVTFSMA